MGILSTDSKVRTTLYSIITSITTGKYQLLIKLSLSFLGMYFCYSKYKFLEDSGTSQEFELKFTFNLDSYTKSKETWLGLGK